MTRRFMVAWLLALWLWPAVALAGGAQECDACEEDSQPRKKRLPIEQVLAPLDEEARPVIERVLRLEAPYLGVRKDAFLAGKEIVSREWLGKTVERVVFTEREAVGEDETREINVTATFRLDYLRHVEIRDAKGNGYDLYWPDKDRLMAFLEIRNNRPRGVYAHFQSNGRPSVLFDVKDDKILSEKFWDEQGALTKSAVNEEPRTLKLLNMVPKSAEQKQQEEESEPQPQEDERE